MSNWRNRGYVSDSEDEGDDLDQHVQNARDEAGASVDESAEAVLFNTDLGVKSNEHVSSISQSPDHDSTASQLERTLDIGLKTIRNILATVPIAPAVPNRASSHDLDDSPLSSPLSSIASSPRGLTAPIDSNVDDERSRQSADLEPITNVVSVVPHRSLRARAPIQEHPYMLEDAKYRQLMKDRGIKPVNVPTGVRLAERKDGQEESQQTEEYQSSQIDETLESMARASPVITQSSLDDSDMQDIMTDPAFADNEDTEDALPDLSQILSNFSSHPHHKHRKNKTRQVQVVPPPFGANSKSAKIHDLPEGDSLKHKPFSQDHAFRVPPSPPRSESCLGDDNNSDGILTIPNPESRTGLKTPGALPTPLMSSEVGIRKRPLTIVSSSDSSEAEGDNPSSPVSSSVVDDDSQGLRRIRQQLRGVLPPSWLTLNMEAQQHTRLKDKALPSPSNPTNERGIARRTNHRRSRQSESSAAGISQLVESESSDSEQLPVSVSKRRTLYEQSSPFSNNKDDGAPVNFVVEDDEIDAMLPSTHRRLNRNKTSKTNQTRLSNGWALSNQRTASDAALAGLTSVKKGGVRSHNTTAKSVKRSKTRHKHHQAAFSVLDAPTLQDMDPYQQPQFLKVAARQARKRAEPMFVSPSKKFFRLATVDDNNDVNIQLTLWENKRNTRKPDATVAGAIRSTQSKTHAAGISRAIQPTTSPLNPVSFSSSRLDLANLKRSTSALLSKISNSNPSRSPITPTLTTVQDLAPTNEGNHPQQPRSLKSFFSQRNRSGQGNFLSRTPKPRVAQIESSSITPRRSVLPPPRTIKVKQKLIVSAGRDQEPQRSAAFPIRHVKQRKPKKQTPHKLPQPTAQMDTVALPVSVVDMDTTATGPATERGNTPDLDHQELDSLLAAVQNIWLLPERVSLHPNSALAEQHVQRLSRRFYNSSYHPSQPPSQMSVITTPDSTNNLSCGHFNPAVRTFISAALAAISSDILDHNQAGQAAGTWNGSLISFASIVTYLHSSAYLRDTDQVSATECLTDFIQDVDNWVQALSNRIVTLDLRSCHSRRGLILQMLSYSAVLVSNLHLFAILTSHDLKHKTEKMCDEIITLVLAIVFDEPVLRKSSLELDVVSLNSAEGDIMATFPEAEAVLVVWCISEMLCGSCPSAQFGQQVKRVIGIHNESNPVRSLYLTLMAACFVLPLTQMGSRGVSSHPVDGVYSSDDGGLFDLLASQLQGVVAQIPSSHAGAYVGPLLEAVEDVSLKMANLCHWYPVPSLLTALLRAYMWNAMLPFNTTPSSRDVSEDLDCISNDRGSRERNDFYKFLDLIEPCMRSLARPGDSGIHGDSGLASGKLRGLVFSLVPNNAQLFDAREEISEAQFLALKNHMALYVTIFKTVPEGYQPRLEQLEHQIDFSTSHILVCRLAIDAWKSIALFYAQQPTPNHENLEGVSRWMNTMLQRSITRFEKHLQFDAITQIQELLSSFTSVIDGCDTEFKARKLLAPGTFDTLKTLLTRGSVHRNNEKIVIVGVKLLHAYASTTLTSPIHDTVIAHVQLVLKSIIQQILSVDTINNAELLRHLMTAWFVTAQTMVRSFHKHWNDFIEPHSNLSIDFLAGLRTSYASYEAKGFLLSKIINSDTTYYYLECRPIVFMTWVATLLLPIQSMRFEHVLTESILKHERDSLMIKDLAAKIFKDGNEKELTLQTVADSRILILRHIIQTIYGQQEYPEEEWLAGGLGLNAQRDLLRTMTKTMKASWIDLKAFPAAQNDYTALVHAILNEMETYPMPGFKIDPWFSGASEFPRPVQTLDNIFKCRFGEDGGDITRDNIRNFRSYITGEVSAGRQGQLVEELIRVFHCVDPVRVRWAGGEMQYSFDFVKQAKFLQIVGPAIIECTRVHEQAALVVPVLRVLIELTERIKFRIDNLDPAHMRDYVATTAAILCAVRKECENSRLKQSSARPLLRYTRLAAASVFALVEYGIDIDERVFEMCVGNILGVYAVVRVHLLHVVHVRETGAPVEMTQFLTEGEETILSRKNSRFGAWRDAPMENFALVPDKVDWVLYFEAEEPELGAKEEELRRFAREDLKGVGASREDGEMEMGWDGPNLEEEMKELVRALKARDLVGEEEEEEGSEEEEFE